MCNITGNDLICSHVFVSHNKTGGFMDSGKILKFPNLLQGACNTYDCCPQIKTLLHKPRNPRALRLQEERRDFYPCLITSLAYLISDVASISIDRLNPASIRLKSKHRDLPFIYAPCSRVEKPLPKMTMLSGSGMFPRPLGHGMSWMNHGCFYGATKLLSSVVIMD